MLGQSDAHSEISGLILHISVCLSLAPAGVSFLYADQLLQLCLRVVLEWSLAQDEM